MTTPSVRPDRGPLSVVSGTPEPQDARVAAVLQVLAGAPAGEVAAAGGIETALLHRWVRSFVDGGTARVTNRPEEDLARQRDRFLGAFAHELRTPLAVARGWAAILADGDLPAEMSQNAAETLDAALSGLAVRVSDVERLAAVSLGRLKVTPVPTTLHEVARLAGVDLDTTDALEVVTDPDLAARALNDLWAATGLAPEPRRRRVVVATSSLWWELRIVRDADPIPPRVLQALFEPFDVNDDDTGVSIGLYLARALVVALGGTIGLEQRDERGEFWLRLPLMASPPHPDTTHPRRDP